MSEKTNMQLAGALRIIRKLLKGSEGANQEAEEFLIELETKTPPSTEIPDWVPDWFPYWSLRSTDRSQMEFKWGQEDNSNGK